MIRNDRQDLSRLAHGSGFSLAAFARRLRSGGPSGPDCQGACRGGVGSVSGHAFLFGRPRTAALRSEDDGGFAVLRLQPRDLLVAGDRAVLPGPDGLHGGGGVPAPGFPHRERLPEAPPFVARRSVRPDIGPLQGDGPCVSGHVSIDGTRIQANASKHKAMSYGRMVKAEAELSEEIREMLSRAEAADEAEDLEHGVDGGSGMLPDHLATKRQRRERIKEHMAALEAQAAAAAEAAGKDPAEAKPEDKAQRNFTDPESRLMKTKDGFGQCYNGQIVVDADNQIIVAHGLTAEGSDQKQLEPMIEAMEASAGELPDELSADAGYCSEENLKLLKRKGIRGHVATGRRKHGKETATGGRPPREGTCRAEMDRLLKREGRDGRYRLRKTAVEPVFGQIKQARRFRQFLMRGVENARREWTLICIAHNLNKLASAWSDARPVGA